MAQRAKRGTRIRALMITGVIALGALQAMSAHAAVPPVSVSSPTSGQVIPSGTSVTVTGTGPASYTIKMSDNNGAVLSTTSDAGGVFSFALGALADGSHYLQVRAADSLGVEGPFTDVPFSIYTDTSIPNITGPSVNVLPATFTLQGTGIAGMKINVLEGTTSLGRSTVSSNGTWTKELALASGSHTLTATATDTQGRTSASSTGFNVLVDANRPTASIDKPANNALIAFCGPEPGNTPLPTCPLPNTSPVHFEGKATDANTPTGQFGVRRVHVKIVNALTGETKLEASPCTGCGLGAAAVTWTLDPVIPEGGYYDVIVTSTDFAGNVSNTAAIEVVIL